MVVQCCTVISVCVAFIVGGVGGGNNGYFFNYKTSLEGQAAFFQMQNCPETKAVNIYHYH